MKISRLGKREGYRQCPALPTGYAYFVDKVLMLSGLWRCEALFLTRK